MRKIIFLSSFVLTLITMGAQAADCPCDKKVVKSKNLHKPTDDLDVRRKKTKALLKEAADHYARDKQGALVAISHPAGVYSDLDNQGDSFVAHISEHGIFTNPAWPNAQKHPLSALVGPAAHELYPGSAGGDRYGRMFLDAMEELKPGESKTLIFLANKRPSTNRPAQAVVLCYKNEDGSMLISPYYPLDILNLDQHASAKPFAG